MNTITRFACLFGLLTLAACGGDPQAEHAHDGAEPHAHDSGATHEPADGNPEQVPATEAFYADDAGPGADAAEPE